MTCIINSEMYEKIVKVVDEPDTERHSLGVGLGHGLGVIAKVLLTDTVISHPQGKTQSKLINEFQLV